MRTYDPGHAFFVDNYSGFVDEAAIEGEQLIMFMHRIGNRYPGNQGSPYDGTNCQEVLRVLIARSIYLNNQIPCKETEEAIKALRTALFHYESRAARVHGKFLPKEVQLDNIETFSVCRRCGHIVCKHRN